MSDNYTSGEDKIQKIISVERKLNEIQDIDILLERILTEARDIVNADAGSIYICENDFLRIRYAQNDTQVKKLAPGQKMPFSFFTFPLDTHSIAGYSILTNSLVKEPDVYNIASDKPYTFNKQPDLITGYRTQSTLAIPLTTGNGKKLGVLQIINPQDKDGNIIDFDKEAELYISHFAANATQALERTYMIRAMILRMIKMAGFRDPKETGAHVSRVSNFAVEIYDRWAFNHNIGLEESNKFRDALKIAAMLHDVGKVAISDLILKKPARFTQEEFEIMQSHTYIGADLFDDIQSPLDSMSRDVALYHHEKWNGEGYPGIIYQETELSNKQNSEHGTPTGLKGEEIPLSARIVAIADVFDALSSKRIYKNAWAEEDVEAEIKNQSGKQFDPEVVQAFFEILPQLRKIQQAWPD